MSNRSLTATQAASCFEVLPELCDRNGYGLITMNDNSTTVWVNGYVFDFSTCSVFAYSGIHFDGDTPDQVKSLTKYRNSGLTNMGWLHQKELRLFMPIIGRQFSLGYLESAIPTMETELVTFVSFVNAHGFRRKCDE